jgi:hypothetical protein
MEESKCGEYAMGRTVFEQELFMWLRILKISYKMLEFPEWGLIDVVLDRLGELAERANGTAVRVNGTTRNSLP